MVVVAVVGYNVLPGRSTGVVGTPPTPADPELHATPAATPSAYACRDFSVTCAGPLDPGTHASGTYHPALTYAVPAGWTNTFDGSMSYVLEPPDGSFTLIS